MKVPSKKRPTKFYADTEYDLDEQTYQKASRFCELIDKVKVDPKKDKKSLTEPPESPQEQSKPVSEDKPEEKPEEKPASKNRRKRNTEKASENQE